MIIIIFTVVEKDEVNVYEPTLKNSYNDRQKQRRTISVVL